ncbi:unnamed protein product [Hymenolepis diminuta]|uniref:DUF7041 domain-containing protein n=1 Tax=Hymenolepis diminuta TaxID=6216 RepID=A0A0R3SSK3_HYMDI|nr:unnamed protein product [Hymenolepis diminuta]VUZ41770.1 unnamed protein product [Hymenolepis diminuta]
MAVSLFTDDYGDHSFQLPDFWYSSPYSWFCSVEVSFHNAGITDEWEMYEHVEVKLPDRVIGQLTHFFRSVPSSDPYTKLKAEVIRVIGPSTQLKQAKSEVSKPSGLLSRRKIESNARETFLDSLSPLTRKFVELSPKSLTSEQLAEMADNVHKALPDLQITSALSKIGSSRSAADTKKLEERINALEEQVAELYIEREDCDDFGPLDLNYDPPRVDFTDQEIKICYYHRKFGDKARKCRPPCMFTDYVSNFQF